MPIVRGPLELVELKQFFPDQVSIMYRRIYCSGCNTSPHNEQRDLYTSSPTQDAASPWQTDEYVARYAPQRSAQPDLAMCQHWQRPPAQQRPHRAPGAADAVPPALERR